MTSLIEPQELRKYKKSTTTKAQGPDLLSWRKRHGGGQDVKEIWGGGAQIANERKL